MVAFGREFPDTFQIAVKSGEKSDRTTGEHWELTHDKTELLQSMGYRVVEQWECISDHTIRRDAVLEEFLARIKIVESVKAREETFCQLCQHLAEN